MFSKPSSNTPQPGPTPTGSTTPPAPQTTAPSPAPVHTPPVPEPTRTSAPRPSKAPSIIGPDLTIEGDVSGGREIQIEGVIKGDVRVENVTLGEGGVVEGGIYAEAVEVRGKVVGSVTAKQVHLYGACHVDGDITYEQLAMETGAFFQGRSLRLQRPVAGASAASAGASKSEPREPALADQQHEAGRRAGLARLLRRDAPGFVLQPNLGAPTPQAPSAPTIASGSASAKSQNADACAAAWLTPPEKPTRLAMMPAKHAPAALPT